jgi:hypothetical protein
VGNRERGAASPKNKIIMKTHSSINYPLLRHSTFSRRAWLLAGLAMSCLSIVGRADDDSSCGSGTECCATNTACTQNLEQTWGIQVSSVFLSGGGNLVDFRYKVLDPVKAATLTRAESKPTLLDQTTGAKLIVPDMPKVGPMRQTVKQPVVGKTYFMLFANTRHHVKSGDKVTIAIGDFRAENLTVE